MTHFYAFSAKAGDAIPAYERTFGKEASAWKWVELRPAERFFTVNMLPERYWY